MRIHREGHGLLTGLGLGLLLLNLGAYLVFEKRWFKWVVSLSALLWGFCAAFFRTPIRSTPKGENLVIAPADGTIIKIERIKEREYFHDERQIVSIFLSVFNVHVNWIPLKGRIAFYRYHPGQYLVAFHPKSSELNERTTLVIEHTSGQKILVRQIAGLIARRISTYPRVSQRVKAGDELGFIKFGSRVDIILPLDAKLKVQPYQTIWGAETILAELVCEE